MTISKLFWRSLLCLLVVACSQPVLESYGCACESRTYMQDEIAEYRQLAQQDDLQGLAEMEEYYRWRAWEHTEGSEGRAREQALSDGFFDRRLELDDPKALEQKVSQLRWVLDDDDETIETRKDAYREAIQLLDDHPKFTMELTDIHDPERPSLAASDALANSLKAMEAP